jgi:hypothetical protein
VDSNPVANDRFHADRRTGTSPPHRYQDCFTAETRATFFRLSQRWTHKAELLAGKDHTQGGNGLLRPGCFGH